MIAAWHHLLVAFLEVAFLGSVLLDAALLDAVLSVFLSGLFALAHHLGHVDAIQRAH